MIFSRKNVPANISVSLCDHNISRQNFTKFIGVIVDDKLSWNKHTQHICKKLSRSIGIISKIKHNLTKESKLTLYYGLVYPYLQYCNVVWGSACAKTLQPLLVKQKQIVRMIAGVNYRDHTSPLYKSLCMLKLPDIHCLEVLKYVKKQLLGNIHSLSFVRASSVHNRNTRNRDSLRPQRPSLT